MNSPVEPWSSKDLEYVNSCPVCGSRARSLLYAGLTDKVFAVAPGAWTLHRCNDCASAYLDPRPTPASIGRAYDRYYTHLAEDDAAAQPTSALVRSLHALQNDYLNRRYGIARQPAAFGGRWLVALAPSLRAKADVQCRHLPPPPSDGGSLLDVGFGNGRFLKIATEAGWTAEGIDFDPKAVKVARALGLNVSRASVAELEARNAQYDIITLSHVIEHVHDPIALLHDVYRMLRPGGRLWLETPNLCSRGAQRFGAAWRGLEVPRHLVLFNPDSLRTCLARVGFKRVEQRWHGMVLFSIYAESAAIARGRCAQESVHQVLPSFAAIKDELHEMLHPDQREFLTLIAYK